MKTQELALNKETVGQVKEWDAGAPRRCYRKTLTSRGWRVKFAVLDYLSAGLTHAAPAAAVAHAPKILHIAHGA